MPTRDLTIRPLQDLEPIPVTLLARERLAPRVCRLVLAPERPIEYRAGQFVNLRRDDGLTRTYSLASVPGLDRRLELHVLRHDGGEMSTWLCESVQPGARLGVFGPFGNCIYLADRPQQPLVLVGTGSGLAPLYGIVRDALRAGHAGPIHLYHGSRHGDGLYARSQLRRLAHAHANFEYVPCLSGATTEVGVAHGRADVVALTRHPSLAGHRVFLCGNPSMVHHTRKRAYLAGAALADILVDPFDLAPVHATPS